MRIGADALPWDAVTDIEVKQGVIRFKRAGAFQRSLHQELGRIPNLPLFFTLVDLLRRARR